MKTKLLYISLLILLYACTSSEEFSVETPYTRTVGVAGGTISFYENSLPGEGFSSSIEEPVLQLVIPENALDKEVTFSIRERSLYINSTYFTAYEILPNDLVFKKPVELTVSYGMDEKSFLTKSDICFYQPYRIALDANITEVDTKNELWIPIENASTNYDKLSFTTSINSTSSLYTYAKASVEADYEICTSSNDHIDIELGGDYNILVIPTGSVSAETTIDRGSTFLPEADEYPQPIIDTFITLATTGSYRSLISNNPILDLEALVFLQATPEQAGDTWLDWPQAYEHIKILLVDTSNGVQYVKKQYDVDQSISNFEEYLFGAKVDEIGNYVIGLPISYYKLRFGGKVSISVYGNETYDTTFENYDFGGARVDLFDVYYDLNVLPGKDQSQGYLDINVDLGNDFNTQEFPQTTQDYFIFRYYDSSDNPHYVRYSSFGATLSYSEIDYENGWIYGQLRSKTDTSAYTEDGTRVGLDIDFQFRISEWYE